MGIRLNRDSANPYTRTVTNQDSEIVDISDFDLRFEIYQDGTTITLTIGDGLSFVTDGTDGKFTFLLSKSRANQLCIGTARVRAFNDSGDGVNGDPIQIWDATATVEGKTYDA
jgi:hypothetical protein